jgi:transcriptional regulator with GAF, ATPase, and Fis domain
MPADDANSQQQKSLTELRAINNLINKICQLRETNHIMLAIISDTIAITGADQGVISLIEPTRGAELETIIRNNKQQNSVLPYKVDSLISGWVLKNGKALKIDDLDSDERFKSLTSEDGRIKSLVCLPMIVRGETLGIMTLVRGASKGPFDDDQCRLAGIMASQSAQILNNARLIEELARKNELLEISRLKLKEENLRLRNEIGAGFGFENIIGKSAALKNALTLASKFAASDAPVLITGETGTGKELIAKAVHYNSDRKEKPLVVKNCGVKTETLLESELFGHVRGSFTGAIKDKIGLFKEADGGAIFLDEIGDAPLSIQAAILRVIQNGEIRPVGASKTETVNVRVVSATNKDLKKEIEAGNFREDLFYRLSALTIQLPSLRERSDDIPLLVEYFLRKIKHRRGIETLTISSAAMDMLQRSQWPGNVRQLENELERASVICDTSGEIDIHHLSPEMIASSGAEKPHSQAHGQLHDTVERVEADIIRAALKQCKGNILQTSKMLGLTRKGLKNKISRYKIEMDNFEE